MNLTKRGIVQVVIFSIITCGIYMFYWTYVTARDLQTAAGTSRFSPVLILLLTILVSPVGFVLLALEADDCLNAIRAQRMLPAADNKVVWIVLGILLPIVEVALVQNEINNIA